MRHDHPSASAALPVARLALRVLIAGNWLLGVALSALLVVSLIDPAWLWRGLQVGRIAAGPGGAVGIRVVMLLGIVAVPVTFLILRALTRVVDAVRAGDPFGMANADRVRTVARGLLALQLLRLVIHVIGRAIVPADIPMQLGGGLAVTGWLTVVLVFVLAGVFRAGAEMRADLAGTV